MKGLGTTMTPVKTGCPGESIVSLGGGAVCVVDEESLTQFFESLEPPLSRPIAVDVTLTFQYTLLGSARWQLAPRCWSSL
jgi:hypothetical protein